MDASRPVSPGNPQSEIHRAVIIANGAAPDEATVCRWFNSTARLICADGGARVALLLSLKPDVVVGDLDSLDEAQQAQLRALGCRLIVYPVAKDWTDLELALKLAVKEARQRLSSWAH